MLGKPVAQGVGLRLVETITIKRCEANSSTPSSVRQGKIRAYSKQPGIESALIAELTNPLERLKEGFLREFLCLRPSACHPVHHVYQTVLILGDKKAKRLHVALSALFDQRLVLELQRSRDPLVTRRPRFRRHRFGRFTGQMVPGLRIKMILTSNMPLPCNDPLVSCQILRSHRASGVKLVCAYADLRTEPVFSTIAEPG